MSDDRFKDKYQKKKNITLKEYLEGIVSESGRSQELQECLKLLSAPVIEKVLSGSKLKDISEFALQGAKAKEEKK
jgi:hypothetical protein